VTTSRHGRRCVSLRISHRSSPSASMRSTIEAPLAGNETPPKANHRKESVQRSVAVRVINYFADATQIGETSRPPNYQLRHRRLRQNGHAPAIVRALPPRRKVEPSAEPGPAIPTRNRVNGRPLHHGAAPQPWVAEKRCRYGPVALARAQRAGSPWTGSTPPRSQLTEDLFSALAALLPVVRREPLGHCRRSSVSTGVWGRARPPVGE
jgi:hypothetical protein